MVSEEYSDTLQPGHATPCGPAMRAAIMERAKELGIAYGNTAAEDDSYVGVWAVTDSCVSPENVGKVYCYSGSFDVVHVIPTHEFLRLMENTKPPKKEWTTEEKLEKAVKAIERLKRQVELCDYRDGLGHDLKMNAAYLDLITLP